MIEWLIGAAAVSMLYSWMSGDSGSSGSKSSSSSSSWSSDDIYTGGEIYGVPFQYYGPFSIENIYSHHGAYFCDFSVHGIRGLNSTGVYMWVADSWTVDRQILDAFDNPEIYTWRGKKTPGNIHKNILYIGKAEGESIDRRFHGSGGYGSLKEYQYGKQRTNTKMNNAAAALYRMGKGLELYFCNTELIGATPGIVEKGLLERVLTLFNDQYNRR